MKVYVPTRRRALTATTPAAFERLRRDLVLVVRPEEEEGYRAAFPACSVEVLPDGLPQDPFSSLLATRQTILDRHLGERFTVADDDLSDLEGPSGSSDPRELLEELEGCLRLGAGLAGPRPARLPPDPQGRRLVPHAALVQLVAVDGPRLASMSPVPRYDRCRVEDHDLVLQVLAQGVDCVRLDRWTYRSTPMGEGAGGLNADAEGNLRTWVERAREERGCLEEIAALWPGYVVPDGHGRVRYRRRALLLDSRRRLGMLDDDEDQVATVVSVAGSCPTCGRPYPGAGAGDPGAGGSKGRRGRPPLGRRHPVVQRMAGKGPFRVSDVGELYKTRNSATVSIQGLVKRGLVRRVGVGLYEVIASGPKDHEVVSSAKPDEAVSSAGGDVVPSLP